MAQIVSGTSVNPQLSDVYILEDDNSSQGQNPLAANCVGVIGTADWGPLNSAQLMGSVADLAATFGDINANSLTDPHDLATAVRLMLAQGQAGAGVLVYGIRTGHGTLTASSVSLNDTTSGTALVGAVATAKQVGKRGDDISITFEAGANTNSVTATVTPFAGGSVEKYYNIPSAGSGAANFWNLFATAVNVGTNNAAPSDLITLGTVNNSAIAPLLGTFALTGGASGRSGVTTADLVGVDTDPRTGIYALRGLQPICSAFTIAGNTDATNSWAAMGAFADSEEMIVALDLPSGTSVTNAIASKKSNTLDDKNIVLLKDFVKFTDPVNGGQRLTTPSPVVIGLIGALPPNASPGNKKVFGIVGTERSSAYGNADLGNLQTHGINLICNPIPRGATFGVRHGRNTSSNQNLNKIPYARMLNYLKSSLAVLMGPYVDEPQSELQNDPTRNAVDAAITSFLQGLRGANQITAFQVICDLTNNSVESIRKGFLNARVRVEFMGIVEFLVVTLEAGVAVTVVTDNQPQ